MQVTFDKNSLIINGKREFIKSGAFHYFRTPGVELACDRFMKLKAAGYNTVDIYLNANYHSKKEGEYDFGSQSRLGFPVQQQEFSDIKNVKKILEVAKEVGLYVIIRPGPFINAEVNAGGIPFWVLRKKDVIPRNRIGATYRYSPEYMKFITQWYDAVIPVINQFDNIIAFQIENEYATDEMDEQYMKELYQMARDKGIKCPIFHNDAYCAGLWADMLDIYACDIYPYINPNQNWKQDHFCFDTVDNLEDSARMFKEDAPIFIAEMQGGWFDKWDGIGYKAMREALSDQHINIMTKTAISQGVTMFNHYMAVGGTSWDDLACDEVYTSYEFTAPIDEYGDIQPNLYKAKEINYFLKSFGLTNTGERENLDLGENIYAVRRKDYENNCNWLFVRNMNEEKVDLSLNSLGHCEGGKTPEAIQENPSPEFLEFEQSSHSKIPPSPARSEEIAKITLHPYDMKICPENLELYACKIKFSDAEIFAKLKDENHEVLFIIADKNSNIYIDKKDEKITISADKNDYENIKFEKNDKSTQFLFISRELANRTWVLDDKVIFNADFVYSNGRIGLSKTTEVAYFDLVSGFSKKYFKFQEQAKIIDFKDFEVNFCAPEIDFEYDYTDWEIHKNTEELDALSIGKYDEFIWYKTKIPNTVEEITLSARHLFALYVNGKEVLNRNSYKYEKLKQIEETISIPFDKTILNKDQNELTLLVQNLGFDKGFSGDTNHPRGLVDFKIKPDIKLDFYVNDKLSFERNDLRESENPYLTKLSAKFNQEFKENVVFAKYLSMENFPYDRATIFLNGVKIGRFLKNTNHVALQDKFYLPNVFLKPENSIDIIIWEKASNIKTTWDFKFELKNVIIQVGDQTLHQLY